MQCVSAEQAATDRYFLAGNGRDQLRQLATLALIWFPDDSFASRLEQTSAV